MRRVCLRSVFAPTKGDTVNHYYPRLARRSGGWILKGAIPPNMRDELYGDEITARAHLLAARRWYRKVSSPEALDAALAEALVGGAA